MGEIAESMLDGTLCQFCGQYVGSDSGIPTSCGCDEEDDNEFKDIRQETKKRHKLWKAENTKAINESGIPHRKVNNDETFLFREKGMPMVDYYPSTGRYRVLNDGKGSKARSGGAKAIRFLKWYLSNKK